MSIGTCSPALAGRALVLALTAKAQLLHVRLVLMAIASGPRRVSACSPHKDAPWAAQLAMATSAWHAAMAVHCRMASACLDSARRTRYSRPTAASNALNGGLIATSALQTAARLVWKATKL